MTTFLITSQILVFFHLVFGELTGVSLLWAIKELVYIGQERLKWLKISLWAAFINAVLAWIVGGTYYLFFYPLVKPVIKEGPQPWGHLIIMEAKEHIFLILPVLTFLLAIFAAKRSHALLENSSLRKKFLWLTSLATLLVFSMAILGYLITWGARTALWLKAGL